MRGLIHEMKQLRPKVDYPETPEHLANLVKLIKRNKRIYGNSRSDLQISEDELNVWIGNEMARPAKVKEALRKKNEFYLCVCNLSDTILQWLRTPQDIQNQIKPLSIKELHILDRKARETPTKKQKMILRKQLIRMEQARKEAEKRRIESERLKKMTLRDKRKEIADKQLAQQKIVQAKLQKAKLRQRKRARRNANQAMKITQQKRNELEQHILNAEMKEEEQWLNIAKPVKYKERHGKQQVRIYRQRKLNQSNIHVPPIMTLNKDVGYVKLYPCMAYFLHRDIQILTIQYNYYYHDDNSYNYNMLPPPSSPPPYDIANAFPLDVNHFGVPPLPPPLSPPPMVPFSSTNNNNITNNDYKSGKMVNNNNNISSTFASTKTREKSSRSSRSSSTKTNHHNQRDVDQKWNDQSPSNFYASLLNTTSTYGDNTSLKPSPPPPPPPRRESTRLHKKPMRNYPKKQQWKDKNSDEYYSSLINLMVQNTNTGSEVEAILTPDVNTIEQIFNDELQQEFINSDDDDDDDDGEEEEKEEHDEDEPYVNKQGEEYNFSTKQEQYNIAQDLTNKMMNDEQQALLHKNISFNYSDYNTTPIEQGIGKYICAVYK